MRKIPTLFIRDWEGNPRYVTTNVDPECQWVIDGEGVATRKYDGTCIAKFPEMWMSRREVKQGQFPHGFCAIATDDITHNTIGWEPIQQSSFYKFFKEAMDGQEWECDTYELIGPKINGNPEHLPRHVLIKHSDSQVLALPILTYEGIKNWLGERDYEGIVWHHPDGRMAKIKRKDFAY